MEKIHGGSANSGLVGRRLSNTDKAVIMWVLDSLADNSMAYVKTVRQVIERQMGGFDSAQPPSSAGVASKVVSRIAHAIRISRGIEPEFVVWMSVDQDLFVKGVVKTMLGLCVERWHYGRIENKAQYLMEYRQCGKVLDRWMLTAK
ncbi:MAG: hypothetical protein Q8K92_08460 [Leadbetterella sp.]|nr:hypothetical protein [Leadbetterella sp.]